MAGAQIYQLRVSLDECEPHVWRRLLVRGRCSLHQLHEVIQSAMGWTNSHLYEFQVGAHRYTALETRDGDDGSEDARQVSVARAAAAAEGPLKYLYDFGDAWWHTVEVEAIDGEDPGATYPRCVAGARACPPEDCGGVWGYFDFLEALGIPAHPEHQHTRSWIGGGFDPEEFNLDDINQRLARRTGHVSRAV